MSGVLGLLGDSVPEELRFFGHAVTERRRIVPDLRDAVCGVGSAAGRSQGETHCNGNNCLNRSGFHGAASYDTPVAFARYWDTLELLQIAT